MRKLFWVVIFISQACFTLHAQGGSAYLTELAQDDSIYVAVSPSLDAIPNTFSLLINDPVLNKSQWGIMAINTKNDSVVASHFPDSLLVPASSMKAITTATALALLGKSFRFETVLSYTGSIDTLGVLHGDIYIKGSGDPTFGSDRFGEETSMSAISNAWVEVVKGLGIKEIQGRIIGDASVFDDENTPPSWLNEDKSNYYGAGSSGLSLNENFCHVIFNPSSSIGGKAVIVGVNPEVPQVTFVNHVSTARSNSGDATYFHGEPFSPYRYADGTIPYRKGYFLSKTSLPDPPLSTAHLFYKALLKRSISIAKIPTTVRALKAKGELDTMSNRVIIATHYSPVLERIITETNVHSINTYAENLLKYMGFYIYHKGSVANGVKVVENFWRKKGVDLTGFVMKDGSGLSRENRVTPRQLAQMSAVLTQDAQFYSFYNSLPVAGKSGSIRYYFKNTPAENNLRAKSGSMKQIKSYTGYVTNPTGDIIAFSIIVNNYFVPKEVIKKKIEKLLLSITIL